MEKKIKKSELPMEKIVFPSINFKELGLLLISSPLFSNLHNRSKWVMGFTSKLQGG
jgi:hypothetical protein